MNELKKTYQKNINDNGSVPMQLFYIENDIKNIKEHLSKNRKDIPAKRSLLKKISQKKRSIIYIKRKKGEFFIKNLIDDINNFFYSNIK